MKLGWKEGEVKRVIVCTNLSGKEPYRQAGVDRIVTSGNLGGVMISTLA